MVQVRHSESAADEGGMRVAGVVAGVVEVLAHRDVCVWTDNRAVDFGITSVNKSNDLEVRWGKMERSTDMGGSSRLGVASGKL